MPEGLRIVIKLPWTLKDFAQDSRGVCHTVSCSWAERPPAEDQPLTLQLDRPPGVVQWVLHPVPGMANGEGT